MRYDAVLVLEEGTVIWGYGSGKEGTKYGEMCFNTSITGHQEIITDPSYAGQIINFTFPHIGNIGSNDEDYEVTDLKNKISCQGIVTYEKISAPSNWRAKYSFDEWLEKIGLSAISGIDTRNLTSRIRNEGAFKACICYKKDGKIDTDEILQTLKNTNDLSGVDLASELTTDKAYAWKTKTWDIDDGYKDLDTTEKHKVVVIDYGVKKNILCNLADRGFDVTVVPATSSYDDIMNLNPDGILLSNGPADPNAMTGYTTPVIKQLVESGIPIFGICLGHQLLSIAMGANVEKMHLGHRGANHPIKNIETGNVEITSQNHGFVVSNDSLPKGVSITHKSLFDGTIAGISVNDKPVFSVQYHPEASPGPRDSEYLFDKFKNLIDAYKSNS